MKKIRLVISDLHADIKAFKCILKVIKDSKFMKDFGDFDEILNLGDVLERGSNPKEVLDVLKELQREFEVKSVLGNHDEAFLYNMPISGSGLESRRAHLKLRNSDLSFFNDLPQFLIDERERIIAVHGGPLDPERIMPQGLGASARWLYQRTWQRIADVSFFDFSGFHYTPEMAFEHVRRENFLILCGHQHLEAAYSGILKDFWTVEDILDDVNLEMREYAGFDLELKSIRRERGFSYLIRLGIAGPEGYRYLGWNRAHFALISKERVYLLSFRLP